jgi:hypothetical protein
MAHTHLASRGALLAGAASLAVLLCTGANAKDPGMGDYMTRVLACDGVDAKMEVYLPQSLVTKGYQAVRKMKPTIGWYTLDLTSAEKGKVMEPVRVSMSAHGDPRCRWHGRLRSALRHQGEVRPVQPRQWERVAGTPTTSAVRRVLFDHGCSSTPTALDFLPYFNIR